MENVGSEAVPQSSTLQPQVPFGERDASPQFVVKVLLVFGGFCLALFAVSYLIEMRRSQQQAKAIADAPMLTAPTMYQTTTPTTSSKKPTGSDAVNPALKGLIERAAKDYGISEEEARQAFIKGGLKAYSKEEVEKQFGK